MFKLKFKLCCAALAMVCSFAYAEDGEDIKQCQDFGEKISKVLVEEQAKSKIKGIAKAHGMKVVSESEKTLDVSNQYVFVSAEFDKEGSLIGFGCEEKSKEDGS